MSEYLSGVMSIGGQVYAIPLSEIDSIESSYQVKEVDGLPMLEVDNKDVVVCDLDKNHDVLADKRRLCVIMGNIALMADEFESKQLASQYLQPIPSMMMTGIVEQLYFNHVDNEFIQILEMSRLPSFLIDEQHSHKIDA